VTESAVGTTKLRLQEAVTTGFSVQKYFPNQRFPRVRILTIAELLQGKQAQYPPYAPPAPLRQVSQRPKGADPQQALL
jgi:hypothetical protein